MVALLKKRLRRSSIPAFVGMLLFPCPVRGDATTEVRLVLDGRDVTKAHPEAVIRFMPRPRKGSVVIPPDVVCSVGQVCSIPPGLYYLEVEDPDLIVETRPRLLVEEGQDGSIPISMHVTRAGFLAIPGGHVPIGGSLEALDERYGVVHARKVDGPVARVRVPGRRVILCAYDEKKGPLGCQSAIAGAGETTILPGLPRPGRGRGQLLVGLTYPDESAPADVRVVLRSRGRAVSPDAIVSGRSLRLFAVWYDAPAGPARLELTSRHWFAREADVGVPERGTAVVSGIALSRKPKLKVSLEGEERLGAGDVSVDVFTSCPADVVSRDTPPPLAYCQKAGTLTGPPGTTFEFPDLDPGLVAVRWRKEPLSNARWVDLRDGESREESVPVEVFEVHGAVRRSGSPVSAEMKWEMGNDVATFRTRTDPDGSYRVFVGQPGEWGVGLRDDSGRVFGDSCVVESDVRCDFDVPSNRVTVRVVDEKDEPVEGAKVNYEVRGPAPGYESRDMGAATTNGTGIAALAPLRTGVLSLKVFVKKFAPGTAQPFEVTEATTDHEVTVRLRRGAGVRISIVTPEGTPARQAQVWSGKDGAAADESGVAMFEAPLGPGSPLIAFDLKGEMAFTRFPGGDSFEVRIPRSGPPIRVRFQRPDGTPVPATGVHVAVDGVLDDKRFFDQAFAAGGQLVSDESGAMRVAGLPAQGVVTIYPFGHLDLAVTRTLPVLEELVFTLPVVAP